MRSEVLKKILSETSKSTHDKVVDYGNEKIIKLKIPNMGAYRLSIYFRWQIGLLLTWDRPYSVIELHLPFFGIYMNYSKYARGFRLDFFFLREGKEQQ